MESTIKLPDHEIYAPSAFTERTYASNISVSPDNKWAAYCVGSVIVLRSLEDLKTCKIFQQHKVKTSAVGFSPNGYFAASGDIEGNVKIWFLDDMSIKKEFNKVLSAKVYGIEWDHESNKLFVFGDGKQAFGRCISWDTASNIGEILGHAKLILTGDIKKSRPYRIATGSEDFGVNFYEGTPFKSTKLHKEHTNFVTGVKFSPDNTLFVSVGFDKKINIYDGKEGSLLYTLAQDKSTGNHTMAIIGVCWIDNTTLATCSLDRSVKIWDLNEKACKFTLYPKEKSLLGVPDSACGIRTNGKWVFTLSLSGVLNFWDLSNLTDEKIADRVIDGHQNYVSAIVHVKSKNLVLSGDVNGKIIAWKADDNEFVKTFLVGDKKVVSLALTLDERTLVVFSLDGSVSGYDIDSGKLK